MTRTRIGKRILVVDDDADVLHAVHELLVEHGYEVTTAATADDAYRAARAIRFDAILLDLMLGENTTGVDVLVALLRDGKPRPSIVLMTGYPPSVVRALFPQGAPPIVHKLPIIHKPPRSEEILAMLAKMTGTR